MALRPAVFIDKDGTLVHDLPFNVDPARVRLRDDAGPAQGPGLGGAGRGADPARAAGAAGELAS